MKKGDEPCNEDNAWIHSTQGAGGDCLMLLLERLVMTLMHLSKACKYNKKMTKLMTALMRKSAPIRYIMRELSATILYHVQNFQYRHGYIIYYMHHMHFLLFHDHTFIFNFNLFIQFGQKLKSTPETNYNYYIIYQQGSQHG